MKRDPIQARVLATKLIPNVAPDLAEQLSLRPEEPPISQALSPHTPHFR